MDETQCKFFIGVHIITSKRKTGKTLEKKKHRIHLHYI